MKRRSLLSAVLASSMLGLPLAAPAMAQDTKIVIAYATDSLAYLPMQVANVMGYFEEEGLAPEFVKTGDGPKVIAAVVSGEADVGIGSSQSVLKAREEGVDIALFSALLTQYSTTMVVSKDFADKAGVTAESTVQEKAAALKGSYFGANPGGSMLLVRYVARMGGLDPDRDMTIVTLGGSGSNMIAAFSQGRVDGFSMSPPSSHTAVADHGGMILFNTLTGEIEALDGYAYIITSAMKPWLEANQDTAERYNRAIRKSLLALRDPVLTVEAREKVREHYYPTTDPAVFELAWADLAAGVGESSQMTRAMVEKIVELSEPIGGSQLDPALIDDSFVVVADGS